MNENTELDLEWAKRGGVVINGADLYRYAYASEYDYGHKCCLLHLKSKKIGYWRCDSLRMATREECESACIEYIERPVSGQELVDLREDKEMLEWMFSPDIFRVVTTDRTYDGTFKSFEVSEVSDLSYSYFDTLSIGSTPREAIRAAMKGGM